MGKCGGVDLGSGPPSAAPAPLVLPPVGRLRRRLALWPYGEHPNIPKNNNNVIIMSLSSQVSDRSYQRIRVAHVLFVIHVQIFITKISGLIYLNLFLYLSEPKISELLSGPIYLNPLFLKYLNFIYLDLFI